MRFKEFAQKRREQQVDEILPALAAAGGALARGAATVGGAALKGAGNLAVQGAKAVGNAAVQGAKTVGQAAIQGAGNLAVQGAKAVGNAVGGAVGQGAKAVGQQAAQGQQTQQPIPLKVGTQVPLANPIGKVKVNKIEPHSITLDTQQKVGINLKVDPAELGNYMQTLQNKASGQ